MINLIISKFFIFSVFSWIQNSGNLAALRWTTKKITISWNQSSKLNQSNSRKAILITLWDWKRTCKLFLRIEEERYFLKRNFSFSNPTVHLERLDIQLVTFYNSTSGQKRKISETVKSLARKGNEGLQRMKAHTCCICKKRISNFQYLKLHIKSIHLKSTKFSCDLCPKIFYSKSYIQRHMIADHSKKRFWCNICDYKTAIRSAFLSHRKTHSKESECPICKKRVAKLKLHVKTHEPKNPCSICSKMIGNKSMRKHIKIHEVKNHKCGLCGEAFEKKLDLGR